MGDALTPQQIQAANRSAGNLALVAGLLLLVAGITGVALWSFITVVILSFLPPEFATLSIVFLILVFLASLGGLMVIGGGIALRGNKPGMGKFLIALGAGFGLIGLIIMLYTWAITLFLPTLSLPFMIGLLGLLLSIAARMKAKKAAS